MSHVLAIDQGTTSSRAIIFDADLEPVATAQREFPQHFPKSGWVEHDPEDIWTSVVTVCRAAIAQAGLRAEDIVSIGITNQRETTLVWDRKTGKPIYNAIVWQDRRTAEFCHALDRDGHGAAITAKTGLLADPYFSATKLHWILDNVDGARDRAARGEIIFGTVDSFLIWRLTGGAVHATDATNAARTMLYDIHIGCWSDELCGLFDVPVSMLPEVKDCHDDFGHARGDILGAAIPIMGVAGDQQAAAMGQACFQPGMIKATYGTGCFALLNTGAEPVKSTARLLTTIAYQFNGKPSYALEGSIFVAGAAVQWLRDGLGVVETSKQTEALARAADPEQGVIMVPAFTGLGAPYWKADCRGALYGLTRNSGPAELARAALESVGFQTRDLLEAMRQDWQASADSPRLRVDGAMSGNDYAMQFLADICDIPVDRPRLTETTALGAAWLAGQASGIYPDAQGFAKDWSRDTSFAPKMDDDARAQKYAAWHRAVQATLTV